MKAFLAGIGIVVSIAISIAIYVWPTDLYASSPNSQVLGKSIDLTDYFGQKGKPVIKNEQSFGTILTTAPAASTSATVATTSATPTIASQSAQITATRKLNKQSYTIAVLGDSMVDTLGPGIPHLASKLKSLYPGVTFNILNYGVGASNIEYGIERLTNDYTYLNEHKPSLLSQKPDVVVVESFAYNHWNNSQSDLDRQWVAITKIVDTIKSRSPGTIIILAASIAPHCPTYTDGSANLPPDRKYIECETVKAYLQNMVNFATSQKYPLADAYHASLSGNDGQSKYINQGDNIHPGEAGKILFAEKVTRAFQQVL